VTTIGAGDGGGVTTGGGVGASDVSKLFTSRSTSSRVFVLGIGGGATTDGAVDTGRGA
jgi:hypothetical protein